MRSFVAFTKKETMAQLRSYRVIVLVALFAVFGVMNTVLAKMTPWLMDLLSETLEAGGMAIAVTEATVLDSWMQFFKNISTVMIAFVIIQSGIFTREYRTGTLILSLTKGLDRYKVVLSKTVVLAVFWTIGYALYFGITYGCNAIFWNNAEVPYLFLSVFLWWLFGLWVIALLVFFSTVARTGVVVLAGVGGTVFVLSLLDMLPRVNEFLPTRLSYGSSLIYGAATPETYTAALLITVVLTVVFTAVSIPLFNKKQL